MQKAAYKGNFKYFILKVTVNIYPTTTRPPHTWCTVTSAPAINRRQKIK